MQRRNKREHELYCDVLGRMPSLLGNRKLNSSMDMLDSPAVAHGYMATKNGRHQE
jgi:hypothetical protein